MIEKIKPNYEELEKKHSETRLHIIEGGTSRHMNICSYISILLDSAVNYPVGLEQ